MFTSINESLRYCLDTHGDHERDETPNERCQNETESHDDVCDRESQFVVDAVVDKPTKNGSREIAS